MRKKISELEKGDMVFFKTLFLSMLVPITHTNPDSVVANGRTFKKTDKEEAYNPEGYMIKAATKEEIEEHERRTAVKKQRHINTSWHI